MTELESRLEELRRQHAALLERIAALRARLGGERAQTLERELGVTDQAVVELLETLARQEEELGARARRLSES